LWSVGPLYRRGAKAGTPTRRRCAVPQHAPRGIAREASSHNREVSTMRTIHWTWLAAAASVLAVVAVGHADTVVTTDGSRLVGTIEQLSEGKLILVTDFAGKLEIDLAKVRSIATDGTVHVALESGDRLVGTVEQAAETEGSVVNTAMGAIEVATTDIKAVWPEDGEDPEFAAVRAQLEEEKKALKPKWTATLEAGATRTEGNTDTLAARGKFNVRRKTTADLLRFYLSAEYYEQNNARTRNEYKGGILYENNVTDRWNWYTRLELEYDEFEDLDLRALAAAGTGYYWLKKPDHELQTRLGVGYRHEAYADGETYDDFVLDLGLDYRVDITPWAQFTHSTVYSPEVEDFDNYRLTLDTALAVPLADSDIWKLKVGMTNEYNSRPQPGFDRLDNTYYANIVLELK
jgi:putative salt-induced outer membrane protein YdiY